MSSKTVASFASSCLLVAILCGVSYYIIQDHCAVQLSDIKTAQNLHIIGGLVGVALLVLSVLQILNKLNDVKIFSYIALVGLVLLAGCMIYAAILVFRSPCRFADTVGSLARSALSGESSNIFTVKDGWLISVFIMDIISALLFLGATSSLYYV